ncbi:MAG: hypothetical protein QMD86_02625 [Patescibacteria group bacterium]|nr:hypothetical protein [Patescibacteria group bacterium]
MNWEENPISFSANLNWQRDGRFKEDEMKVMKYYFFLFFLIGMSACSGIAVRESSDKQIQFTAVSVKDIKITSDTEVPAEYLVQGKEVLIKIFEEEGISVIKENQLSEGIIEIEVRIKNFKDPNAALTFLTSPIPFLMGLPGMAQINGDACVFKKGEKLLEFEH